MGYAIKIGAVTIQTDSLDEAEALARRLASTQVLDPIPRDLSASDGAEMAPLMRAPRSGHGTPRPALIKSASKSEAAFKLFKSLKTTSQKNGVRYLVTRGKESADAEELRRAAGFPDGHRMSGFTAGITRRAPAFGLDPDDVLIVESPGIIGGVRIYKYRLGEAMLEALREETSLEQAS